MPDYTFTLTLTGTLKARNEEAAQAKADAYLDDLVSGKKLKVDIDESTAEVQED